MGGNKSDEGEAEVREDTGFRAASSGMSTSRGPDRYMGFIRTEPRSGKSDHKRESMSVKIPQYVMNIHLANLCEGRPGEVDNQIYSPSPSLLRL